MKLSHIVAASENGVIGINGTMPWHLKSDFQYFKKTTMGACMIMGRKTFESIGKALPGRYSVIITRSKDFKAEGAQVVHSLDEAIEACKKAPDAYRKDVAYIIGGGDIYAQSIGRVDQILLTRIARTVEGDTFYPDPVQRGFRLIHNQPSEENGYQFSFLTFERADS